MPKALGSPLQKSQDNTTLVFTLVRMQVFSMQNIVFHFLSFSHSHRGKMKNPVLSVTADIIRILTVTILQSLLVLIHVPHMQLQG